MAGKFIADEKAVWQVLVHYARATSLGKLAPHDLRRTCAKLCRKAGGELEQIQLLLGHPSVQTTERNLDHDLTSRGEECSDRQRRSLGSIHELRHSFLRPHGAAMRRTLPPSKVSGRTAIGWARECQSYWGHCECGGPCRFSFYRTQ